MRVEELRNRLPNEFVDACLKQGIEKLSPPQELAVENGLLDGKNFVIAAPTASGKTLIAEMCIARSVFREKKKAIYVAPMRALVSEKFTDFKKAYPSLRIAMSIGDLDALDPWLAEYDLVLTSTEKLDSLIRHGANWLENIGCMVFDEVHMLDDAGRGPTLEILIARLRRICKDAQVVALSATVGNANEIADWLKAGLVESDYRPVLLEKGIELNSKVYYGDKEEELEGTHKIPEMRITQDTLERNKQILLFYSTKRNAESGAGRLGEVVVPYLKENEKKDLKVLSGRILHALDRPTAQCEKLAKAVETGVAFHHGGLVNEQRRLIEDAFKNNILKAICATTTLCLPPNQDIICNPKQEQIQYVQSQDKVLTHNGQYRRVLTPIKSDYNGTIVEIRPYGQLPMSMTEEHRVLVVKRKRHNNHFRNGRHKLWWTYSEPEWVEAKSVIEGDLVLFPRIREERGISVIKMDKIGPLTNQTGVVGKHWRRLNTDDIELNLDTMEFMGLFIAEGYTGKNGILRLAINMDELDLTELISKWFTSLGLVPVVKDFERHRRTINVCSKQLSYKFRELFGGNALEKHLPQEFLFLDRERLVYVVRGMWRGDGYLYRTKTYGDAEYSTISKVLANQLFIILVKLGYMPRIKYADQQNVARKDSLNIQSRHRIYKVSVSGKQLSRFTREVLNKKVHFSGNRTYNLGFIDDNYYYMPVKSIKNIDYSGAVYNLEVEDDASYVGSFIVHNSLGVNLPAHTVVVRDTTRYSEGEGAERISVNEVTQLFGRAGRPKYDKYGRALLIARSRSEIEELYNRYIVAELEPVVSKLGVLPILRTHILAFVATRFLTNEESILGFLSETLYGYQYSSMSELRSITRDVLAELSKWGFVEKKGSVYNTTKIGERVSELYIDPLSARWILDSLTKERDDVANLFMVTNTIEMRPYMKATDDAAEAFMHYQYMLNNTTVNYDSEDLMYYDPIKPLSTALLLHRWINETSEQELTKAYSTTPGAIFSKITNADWLLYACTELGKLARVNTRPLLELRIRMKYGIKKELTDLVRLEQVGRVRARMLYGNGITSVADLRKEGAAAAVERLFGKELTRRILDQVKTL